MTTTPSAAGGGGHTPGEWLIARTDKAFVYSLNEQGYNRFWAHVQGGHTARMKHTSDAELEANARLICAAPALLEALQELVQKFDIERQWHSAKGGDDYPDSTEITRARAAIAASTGASQ